MTDEDDLRQGDRSLRQMLRAREEAKVEQILDEYQQRVRTGGLSRAPALWPKLKFSRAMGGHTAMGGHKAPGTGGQDGRGRPPTPRASQLQDASR